MYKNQIKNYFLNSYRKGLEFYWTSVTEKNAELRAFIKIIKKSNKKPKLLDIGCGVGKHAILVAKRGIDAYGIDFSPIAIKKAKKEASLQKTKVNFKVGDALNVNYPKNYFDAVIDFSCFTHITQKNWNKYFKQVSRVLKPNGYFLISVWSKNSRKIEEVGFDPKTSKKDWNLVKRPRMKGVLYNHYFTKKNLIKLLKRKTFEIFLIKEVFLCSYTKIFPSSKLKLWFVFCRKK